MTFVKGRAKTGGRKQGQIGKTNALIKEATLMAAEIAGNEFPNKDGLPGLVNYLRVAAKKEMPSFLGLLAKILPTQLVNKDGDDVQFTHIERVIINANGRDYRAIAESDEASFAVIDAERVPALAKTR
jgi:hypothetical protein